MLRRIVIVGLVASILMCISGCWNPFTEGFRKGQDDANGPIGKYGLSKEDIRYYVFLNLNVTALLGAVTEVENIVRERWMEYDIGTNLEPKLKEVEYILNELEDRKPPAKFNEVYKELEDGVYLFRRLVSLLREGFRTNNMLKIEEAMNLSYTAGYHIGKAQAEAGYIIERSLR